MKNRQTIKRNNPADTQTNIKYFDMYTLKNRHTPKQELVFRPLRAKLADIVQSLRQNVKN